MTVVLAVAVLLAWLAFKPSGSDTAARESAAALGITVSDTWRVDAVDGGFDLTLDAAPAEADASYGYSFHIAPTPAVSAPPDASTWEPNISGATAYADGEPPTRVLIDARERGWIVTPLTWSMYQDEERASAAWHDVAGAISFTSAQ
ncbi:hypothetical protein [Demequina oxidasica]|uniref:hypothetical protein n=1 Tax=Demequina oxidasica TaxID=676199 RepID=UPI000782219D|nr:hypothetical protein [Demequina oxidasica]